MQSEKTNISNKNRNRRLFYFWRNSQILLTSPANDKLTTWLFWILGLQFRSVLWCGLVCFSHDWHLYTLLFIVTANWPREWKACVGAAKDDKTRSKQKIHQTHENNFIQHVTEGNETKDRKRQWSKLRAAVFIWVREVVCALKQSVSVTSTVIDMRYFNWI